MEDEKRIIESAIQEIKASNDESLEEVIAKWFDQIRFESMKIGVKYMSAAIFGVIEKHIKKKEKPSLRDYKRMTEEIAKIISVQLVTTEQNDSKEDNSDGE